jgi:hypothetical protein
MVRLARPAPEHDAVTCARPVCTRLGTVHVQVATPAAAETLGSPFCFAPDL